MLQPNVLQSPVSPSSALPAASAGLPPLDSQAFLKLLVTQLQHQDPLSPADPSETVQQLAALTQVSSLQEISALLRQLLGKGSSYDPAAWLGRSALVPSSGASTGTAVSQALSTTRPVLRSAPYSPGISR